MFIDVGRRRYRGPEGNMGLAASVGLCLSDGGAVCDADLFWEVKMRPLEPPEDILIMAETGEAGVKEVPSREVAYLVHKGPHSGLQDSFLKLMRWISENGYELMGPGEAVFHNDTVTVKSEEDLVTELRFPVRKKD